MGKPRLEGLTEPGGDLPEPHTCVRRVASRSLCCTKGLARGGRWPAGRTPDSPWEIRTPCPAAGKDRAWPPVPLPYDSQVPAGPGPVFALAPFAWQSPGCPLQPHPKRCQPTRARGAWAASGLCSTVAVVPTASKAWSGSSGHRGGWLCFSLVLADHRSLPGSCMVG